jgi:hypothetical protein
MAKRINLKIDENDFEALDRLAHSITFENTRPLSPAQRRQWEEAKRGRPRKAPGTKAVPTLITVDPKLLKEVDDHAKRDGVSRSQFFADAVRRRLRAAG